MGKDPAFLFYDGDAAKDVSHMNRLERGCYFDLIQAQRKFGGYTAEQARKILGKDFEECWDALELVLSCADGKYFIPWVADSVSKRKIYAEKQRKRIQDYWDDKKGIPRNNRGKTTDIPVEDENENAIEDTSIKRKEIPRNNHGSIADRHQEPKRDKKINKAFCNKIKSLGFCDEPFNTYGKGIFCGYCDKVLESITRRSVNAKNPIAYALSIIKNFRDTPEFKEFWEFVKNKPHEITELDNLFAKVADKLDGKEK